MSDLIQDISNVTSDDDYKASLDKIGKKLQSRTNAIVQCDLLFANFPQGTK